MPLSTGVTISLSMRCRSAVVHQRARGERAHAAGVGSQVPVEDALVILRRQEGAERLRRRPPRRTRPRVRPGTLRGRPARPRRRTRGPASRRGSPTAAVSGSGATTTPLPAARPSALTTTASPSSRSRTTCSASSAERQTRYRAVGTPMARHEVFGKCLTGLELGGGAGGAEQRAAAVGKVVSDSGRQRRLGADDGQVGAYGLSQGEGFGRVAGVDRGQFDGSADARVPGSANDVPDVGVEGEAPTERMFARAGAKDKDAHGVRRGSGKSG